MKYHHEKIDIDLHVSELHKPNHHPNTIRRSQYD